MGDGRDPAFFRIDPLGLLQDGIRGRGHRTDIARLLQNAKNYREALESEPDTVARGRHVVLDYFKLKEA